MNSANLRARQGYRLLQIGVALFLLTSFEGFAIPYFASPIVGRSAHTLSALFGLMLLAFGLVWLRLRLGAALARIAFCFVLSVVRDDEVCRRLITVPGVGPVVALTYRATVDVPARFRKSKSVGAVFGLTCSRD